MMFFVDSEVFLGKFREERKKFGFVLWFHDFDLLF
jgi:hypothetical protein